MKELLGIILLTLLVVLGSCNSNTTDQRGYIVKKRVVACDNKKFKKITLDIFDEVKSLKIAGGVI